MFFLAGISDKVKDCGTAPNGTCPVCGRSGTLHITTQYMTPHLFFIPLFRFGGNYWATCGHCASMMMLDKHKGKAVERDSSTPILPDDLTVLQNNAAPVCPRCGSRLPRGSAFCNCCGERL